MLKAERDDVFVEPEKSYFVYALIVILVVLAGAGAAAYYFYSQSLHKYDAVFGTIGVSALPTGFSNSAAAQPNLERLQRDPCNREALFGLSLTMNEAGFGSDARQALSAFDDRCTTGPSKLKASADALLTLLRLGRSPNTKTARNSTLLLQAFCNQPAASALVSALENDLEYKSLSEIGSNFLSSCAKDGSIAMYTAQAFYRLSDYASALATINQISNMTSEYADAASWQGFILEKLNRNAEAASAFEKALYIYTNLKTVSSGQFYYITRALKAAGQYCKAIHPMELYLSFDPEKRRTEEIDKIIAELKALGRCAPDVAAGAVVVRLRSDGGVYLLDATIDGVAGTFILDTGASTVHLTKSFSSKLGMTLDGQSMIVTRGATGTRKDYIAQVKKVNVGSAQANDVTVTVASDDTSLGQGIDGLLGQSVLSRFKVGVDATARTLSLDQRR